MRARAFPCVIILLAWFALCVGGCSDPASDAPRSEEDLFQARLDLPRLYLTAETNTRVIAPARRGCFVDDETGEVCWPALACQRPDCPGRSDDGEPHIFIAPDHGVYARDDGTVDYDESRSRTDPHGGLCPACLQGRDPQHLSKQERKQFVNWVRPYVLPETAEQMARLDAERKRRKEFYRERMDRPAN